MIPRRHFVAGCAAMTLQAGTFPVAMAESRPMTVRDHIDAIAAKFGGRDAMEAWEYRFLEVVVTDRFHQMRAGNL